MSRTLQLKQSLQFASASPSPSLYNEQATNKLLDALVSLPDPDEVLTRAGLNRCELRKLESDDEITAATDTRRESVIATPWHLERDGKPAEDAGSVFIWDELTPWMELLTRGAWAAVPYGYSVVETVYAQRGARVGIDFLAEKPFEWFRPQHRGGLKYVSMENPTGVEVDTRFKYMLTVREPTYRQPQGAALYSRLYWAWFFRRSGWQFWMKHLERWGIPFLLGHTSGKAGDMARELAKMVQNAVGAVGANDKVEALQVTGTAHFEAFERAVCSRVQKVILGQTLTTDAGGSTGKSGSYALGQVHNEVRKDRRNADLRLVSRTVQHQVEALWELNRFTGVPPEVKFEDDTGLQMERAERDAKLYAAGVRFTPEYLKRVYDFEEGDVSIQETPTPPADGQPPPKKGEIKAARQGGLTREQQAVEDLIEASVKQLTSPVDPEQIKNAIRAARNPEDLAERLAILFRDSNRDDFAVVMERCLFAADVMGYAHASPT